ncbi:hypothetical protein BJ138DRAFT_1106538 [Hygrophoropsis aurantiaca]|uniref:Uncharacterized protein n=1 Tax=Hygrophoropsis aurantiaca TaxID=72124 RepID=A0ACB7ZVP7_9AGAM|nr:hypothetical protein BJ138DRAFT_1106538 [Hygrophoropsis aurantiaca]
MYLTEHSSTDSLDAIIASLSLEEARGDWGSPSSVDREAEALVKGKGHGKTRQELSSSSNNVGMQAELGRGPGGTWKSEGQSKGTPEPSDVADGQQYLVSSGKKTGVMAQWYEAGDATQGVPGGKVRKVQVPMQSIIPTTTSRPGLKHVVDSDTGKATRDIPHLVTRAILIKHSTLSKRRSVLGRTFKETPPHMIHSSDKSSHKQVHQAHQRLCVRLKAKAKKSSVGDGIGICEIHPEEARCTANNTF